ncbi:hypothetical protein Q3G72_014755 [Acer saccharum]|nr:hypothetical protein Q3G72_014755 [Acer saccharum]
MPVFYKVNASDVRKQTGSFKDSFAKHKNESQEEVQKWREALTEASNSSGWDSYITRSDSELVDEIVEGKRSRLWKQDDVISTLRNDMGTEEVEGISLEMGNPKDVHLSCQDSATFLKNHSRDLKNQQLNSPFFYREVKFLTASAIKVLDLCHLKTSRGYLQLLILGHLEVEEEEFREREGERERESRTEQSLRKKETLLQSVVDLPDQTWEAVVRTQSPGSGAMPQRVLSFGPVSEQGVELVLEVFSGGGGAWENRRIQQWTHFQNMVVHLTKVWVIQMSLGHRIPKMRRFYSEKATSLAFGHVSGLAEELRIKPCHVVFIAFSGGPKACMYKDFSGKIGEIVYITISMACRQIIVKFLSTPIAVHMKDKTSGNLKIIAEYGEEYGKENPIRVLYHGYGRYDVLRNLGGGGLRTGHEGDSCCSS